MDKDLLDISGEDEDYWLLRNTPKKGVTSFAGGNTGREMSYLDCSPLQIPRSNRAVPTRPPFSPIGKRFEYLDPIFVLMIYFLLKKKKKLIALHGLIELNIVYFGLHELVYHFPIHWNFFTER